MAILHTLGIERGAHFCAAVAGAEQGGIAGWLAFRAEELVGDEERRAERAARIASGGGDPQIVEDARAEEHAVGHAVQRDAAREHKMPRAGECPRVSRHAEDDLLRHALDARCEVHLALGDGAFRRARRAAKEGVETRPRHREPVRVAEVTHVHSE